MGVWGFRGRRYARGMRVSGDSTGVDGFACSKIYLFDDTYTFIVLIRACVVPTTSKMK